MNSIIKYRKIIATGILFLLLLSFTIILLNLKYEDFRNTVIAEENEETLIIELKIGEEYYIGDFLKEARKRVKADLLAKIDGQFELFTYSSAVKIKGDTVIADKVGVGHINYVFSYTEHVIITKNSSSCESKMITLLNIKFIVTDDNENNYVPVYSIKDIGAEHKTYILMNDIVISEENERSYIHYIFNGVLINPYGHKITIAETSNILILFYVNRGIIDGIKMNGKIYNSISSMPGIVMGFGNQGLIRNCDINLDIEAEYISMYLKNVYNTKIAGNYKILHSEIANEPKGFIISEINSSKHNNIDITVEGPLEYIILPDNEMIGDNMINVSVRSSGEED